MIETPQLEDAIWSVADGRGTDDHHTLLLAHREAARPLLDRIIGEIEDDLAAVTRRGAKMPPIKAVVITTSAAAH